MAAGADLIASVCGFSQQLLSLKGNGAQRVASFNIQMNNNKLAGTETGQRAHATGKLTKRMHELEEVEGINKKTSKQ